MKLIFVTGGVVSSLGKGITAASLAALLESCGHRVSCMKLDPYINVDPGTMSPSEHGEVFVTQDGYETDLDLGHYERFMTSSLRGETNYVTSGRVYGDVIRKERRGDYLGKTVQVVPHVTDYIQEAIEAVGTQHDIVLVEVGGTVGDIESLPFLESIRQLRIKHGYTNVMFIHLTLLPFVKTAGELKTKPTQHSVKELRSIGIQPDVLICRAEREIHQAEKDKIGLFTNVKCQNVISIPDVESIYSLPQLLSTQAVHEIVNKQFGLPARVPNLKPWHQLVAQEQAADKSLCIALVGKYVSSKDAYKSLHEALSHAAIAGGYALRVHYLNSESLTAETLDQISPDAILVPGGFGERGIDGKLAAVTWARKHTVPYLGICFGMQLAVIEFCRNVLGIDHANSTELDSQCAEPVVCLIDELQSNQEEAKNLGGSMRLGSVVDEVHPDTHLADIYQSQQIDERHRHRYEVNPAYIERLEAAGMRVSARSKSSGFIDAIEIADHPWFIGCQFHPEFNSKPLKPHPLFVSFLESAREYQNRSLSE
tara:strand:+ start:1504 stop:3120 length:1617 start_codon:yes stop_codon:yes gene_type:complete